jgi:hypothetical protein
MAKNKKKFIFFIFVIIKMLEMLGKRSRAKRSNPKSKKSCDKAHMQWVAAHKSHSAKGKVVKVKGACKKSKSKGRK